MRAKGVMLLKKLKETTKKVWYYMILSKSILIISIEAAQAQKHNIYQNISKEDCKPTTKFVSLSTTV